MRFNLKSYSSHESRDCDGHCSLHVTRASRGEALDARTDLFSLGIVLYEMATGRQPFAESSSAVIFNQILEHQPVRPGTLNRRMPARLDEIIEKTLEKDLDLRCQTAAELRGDLKRLKRDSESGRVAASLIRAGSLPDSNRFVFLGNEKDRGLRLWVQSVDGSNPIPISPEGIKATQWVVSPDGKLVAPVEPDHKGYLFSVDGGEAKPFLDSRMDMFPSVGRILAMPFSYITLGSLPPKSFAWTWPRAKNSFGKP